MNECFIKNFIRSFHYPVNLSAGKCMKSLRYESNILMKEKNLNDFSSDYFIRMWHVSTMLFLFLLISPGAIFQFYKIPIVNTPGCFSSAE